MTVVVPVRNRPELILRTLDSIKAQTWRPLRVIVVDNASTDDTPRNVEKWIGDNAADDFSCIMVSEETPGPAAARNRGLQEVETRLMMHFDSDDIMHPGHIESVMRRFLRSDHPDLVCWRVRIHALNGRVSTTHAGETDMTATHILHTLLRTHGYACETALARRAGGWNEKLQCWEDLEFGLRIMLDARNRTYISDVNVDIMARKDSVTGPDYFSRYGDWERALDAMEADLREVVNRRRTRWLRLIAYRKVNLAAIYRREGHRKEAKKLLIKALVMPELTRTHRTYLKLAYTYTALGGRGAARLLKYLL